MKTLQVLGMTGGIGSGKSYVSAIFARMGVPVYDSDSRTKELYLSDSSLKSSLIELLGADIFENGVFQPAVMGKRIFSDPALLGMVEELVHPAVMRNFSLWKNGVEREGKAPFVIMESAILLEKPFVRSFANKVAVVSAPLELRISRVMHRDSVSRSAVEARLARQWSDEQRISLADFVIFADGESPLLPQIADIYNKMRF